jgi:hypothetical protein
MPSAAAWPTRASIARRALELIVAAAVAAALCAPYPAKSDDARGGRVERHEGFDRLIMPRGDERPVPLLRRGDGSYRLALPAPLTGLVEMPRGLARFEPQRNADGSIAAIDLVPAPGSYLRFRSLGERFALDIVHGLGSPAPVVTALAPAAGPLPPKVVHAGVLFASPHLAAFRMGDELVLVMPLRGDLDPAAIPPARVAAATAIEQSGHRIVRLRLRPDTQVEIVREGGEQWRLGFGVGAAAKPIRVRFAADGRSAVVVTESGADAFASITLPEFGAVAVLLAADNWSTAPARSPYLDVLEALVGGVVVPRTDALAIERRADGIAVNGVSRRAGG